MNRNSIIALILILLAITSVVVFGRMRENAPVSEEPAPSVISPIPTDTLSSIKSQITTFGSRLKNVSLLSPNVKNHIETEYNPFVSPELLAQWQAHPSEAIGRTVSSPWPDRIDVVEITKQSDAYTVEANVIEITSADKPFEPAAIYPITLTVQKIDGQWLITSLKKGAYSQVPQRVSKTGFWECLPHTDTSGPQTLECAFGLKVENDNTHYALDLRLLETGPLDYPTGSRIRVEGILIPAEQLSTDYWRKYPIEGIISVTSVQKI